jgi:hypothetical protein
MHLQRISYKAKQQLEQAERIRSFRPGEGGPKATLRLAVGVDSVCCGHHASASCSLIRVNMCAFIKFSRDHRLQVHPHNSKINNSCRTTGTLALAVVLSTPWCTQRNEQAVQNVNSNNHSMPPPCPPLSLCSHASRSRLMAL